MIGNSNSTAYVSAWRIMCVDPTGSPSSENPTTPASASASIGASCDPARPTVIAPICSTRTRDSASARRLLAATTSTQSTAGLVFGIAHIVVNPPRAAASDPERKSSFHSSPGVRRCVCRSIKPGVTILPDASINSTPSRPANVPGDSTALTKPPTSSTSAGRSTSRAGSITLPPRMTVWRLSLVVITSDSLRRTSQEPPSASPHRSQLDR